MELQYLLCLECSCEHLMSLDVLVEYPMPCGIGSPCAVKGVLGLNSHQMGGIAAHQGVNSILIPSRFREGADEVLWRSPRRVIGRGGGEECRLILLQLVYREQLLHIRADAAIEGLGVDESTAGQGSLAAVDHLRVLD